MTVLARYAMSGTELLYGGTRRRQYTLGPRMGVRCRYGCGSSTTLSTYRCPRLSATLFPMLSAMLFPMLSAALYDGAERGYSCPVPYWARILLYRPRILVYRPRILLD
eukprot:3087618-Rhodomonas_salina.2